MAQFRLSFVCLFLAAGFLWLATAQRLGATYLEDDMLWFIPSVEHTLHTQPFFGILKTFHSSEMTLFDGLYFYFFLTVIGHHFPIYAYASFFCHFLDAVAFFMMLCVGLRLSPGSSLLASLIYLTFYGQYHAYLWPMAAHHLWVLFFTFTMMTLYLIADRRLDENEDITKIYWWIVLLALCAGINRMSILVIPLMMLAHVILTNKNIVKLVEKVQKWLPIVYLLTVYQVVIAFSSEHQDVLSKILPQHSHLLSWPLVIFISLAWAVSLMAFFTVMRIALKKSIINKFNKGGWPWHGLLFFTYPLGVSCYSWFAPLASIKSKGVFERWQLMSLPNGNLAHWGWLLLGAWLLFYLIHLAIEKRELSIFLVWYLFLVPYLTFQGENIPSRYLIYVSPVFALSLALFWERLPWKWIKKAALAGLVILMAVNILAIHERSLLSWPTDYRWSYDFIKYAYFIKADLIQKKIKPAEASLCLQHVGPIPYLDRWRGKFLSYDFDGYKPLIDITESVLGGSPHSFEINKPCTSEDLRYDAWGMNSAKINILGSPLQGNSLGLFAQDYDPDLKIIQNDRLIYEDSIFPKPLDFVQGQFMGNYKGFSVFYFGDYFFVIPEMHFNLIQFKLNSYRSSYAAKTLWEVRQWVDEQLRIPVINEKIPQLPSSFVAGKVYMYKLSCWAIPLGIWQWETQEGTFDHNVYTISIFSLKPCVWFDHHYRYVYKAILDSNLLPTQSQEGSLDKINKNVAGIIRYNHHQEIMQRRGYKEDILHDTRDLAGLLTWGLKQNYQRGDIYQTSFHEGRNLYQCEIIPVKTIGNHIFVNIHISRIFRDLTIRPCGRLEAQLIRQGDDNLPVQLFINFGLLHIPINFDRVN